MIAPLPHYVGCLQTSTDYKSKASLEGNITVAKCIQTCDLKGDSYALIEAKLVDLTILLPGLNNQVEHF